MPKIEIGAIETRDDFEGLSTTIELDKTEQNPFPTTVGYIKIFIKGKEDKDLIRAIETQVKRTINAFNK